ncbi:alpha/beta fold hydrolase [Pseudoalteromonas sp. SSDWG2]|uniref:alpha/beta fold hydrolase n=1 Tax=Pseudoalteromonas sp. SSDWG2 TaxID=3139391 RepID=UPI003BA8CC82
MRTLFFILFMLFSGAIAAKPTVVFVHGAWGGGWDYKHMQSLLQAQGYEVYRPTLTGLGERYHLSNPNINLDTHISDITQVLEFEDLNKVILVGHSYGGMVITGVAERVPERIHHLLYIDALLPVDGESVMDTMSKEEANALRQHAANNTTQPWAIPPLWQDWGKDVPHPIGTYEQAITLSNPLAMKISGTYVLAQQPHEPVAYFGHFAERAKAKGWPVITLPSEHNIHRAMPNDYVQIITSIE